MIKATRGRKPKQISQTDSQLLRPVFLKSIDVLMDTLETGVSTEITAVALTTIASYRSLKSNEHQTANLKYKIIKDFSSSEENTKKFKEMTVKSLPELSPRS